MTTELLSTLVITHFILGGILGWINPVFTAPYFFGAGASMLALRMML